MNILLNLFKVNREKHKQKLINDMLHQIICNNLRLEEEEQFQIIQDLKEQFLKHKTKKMLEHEGKAEQLKDNIQSLTE